MAIKLAIIGFGKSAQRYHLPYLKIRDTYEVIGVCDLNWREDKVKLADTYGIQKRFDTIEEVLENEDIQVVTLCTPPQTHFDLAKKFLEAGKHVVVEKPFCENVAKTKELLLLANENNKIVIPYQNRRFDSDYLTLKKVIERKYVGEIFELEAHIDYYRPSMQKPSSNDAVDGSFYGLGIHAIDQIVALFGRPDKVFYDLKNITFPDSPVDNYFEIQLFYQELKVILKSSQLSAMSYPRYRLMGEQGTYIKYGVDQQENDLKLQISPGTKGFGEDTPSQYGKVTYRNTSGDWIQKDIPTVTGDYGRFYDQLLLSIEGDKKKFISDEEIITSIEVLEKAYQKEVPFVDELPL